MFKYTPSIINFTNLEIKKRKFEKKMVKFIIKIKFASGGGSERDTKLTNL